MAISKPVVSVSQVVNNQTSAAQVTKVGEKQVVDGKLVADFRDTNPGVIS
jgi:hypothetical protein